MSANFEDLKKEWDNCPECQPGIPHHCSVHDWYGLDVLPNSVTGYTNVAIGDKCLKGKHHE